MHTGGEPLRIVTSGYPALEKATSLLDKLSHVKENLDHLRKYVWWICDIEFKAFIITLWEKIFNAVDFNAIINDSPMWRKRSAD